VTVDPTNLCTRCTWVNSCVRKYCFEELLRMKSAFLQQECSVVIYVSTISWYCAHWFWPYACKYRTERAFQQLQPKHECPSFHRNPLMDTTFHQRHHEYPHHSLGRLPCINARLEEFPPITQFTTLSQQDSATSQE